MTPYYEDGGIVIYWEWDGQRGSVIGIDPGASGGIGGLGMKELEQVREALERIRDRRGGLDSVAPNVTDAHTALASLAAAEERVRALERERDRAMHMLKERPYSDEDVCQENAKLRGLLRECLDRGVAVNLRLRIDAALGEEGA